MVIDMDLTIGEIRKIIGNYHDVDCILFYKMLKNELSRRHYLEDEIEEQASEILRGKNKVK